MATDVEALLVRLEADISKYERAMQRAVSTTERRSREMRKALSDVEANAETSLSRAGTKFGDAIAGGVRGGIAGLAATMSVGTIVRYSDEWTNLTNRLKSSGVESTALAATQERLIGIAQRSRSSLSDVAELYSKLSITGKELGVSQNDVATATETITKSLKMSGASTGEVQAAILQLGQALQSGTLQGDELRSLLENAPGLARIIAKEFGVAVGQLKELGSQGQLEAGRVFKAIVAGAPEVNRAFAQTTATFSDYITSLQNALLGYVGALQRLLQSSPELRRALQEQKDAVDALNDAYGVNARAAAQAAMAQEARDSAKQRADLKATKTQLEELELTINATIAAFGNFAAFPLRAEDKAEVLRIVKQALEGDADAAARAQAALIALGETNPSFAAANAAFGNLLERLGQLKRGFDAVNAAAMQGPPMPETPAPPKFFSGAAKAGEAQATADAEAQAKALINDQLIRAKLDDNARKVQDKVDELRKKLNSQGLSADPETLRKNAQAIVTAEAAGKGGGGKTDEIERFAEALQKTLDPTIEFNKQIDQLFQAIDRGLIPAEKAAEAFTLIGERTLEAGNKAAASKSDLEGMFKGVESAVQSVGSKLGDTLGELATGGQVDFKKLADSIIKDLIRIATQILIMQPLIDSLKSAFKGGEGGTDGGGFGSLLSGLLGGLSGARANGGPVSGGSAYLVGERGPEIFVPSRPGAIVPNGAGSGGGGAVVNVTVQNNAGAEIGVRQSRGPNGLDIQLVVEQAVLKSMNGGAIGRQMASYGFNRMNAR